MSLLETVKAAEGMTMVDEDGNSTTLKLLSGLSPEKISDLEKKLPCPIPQEVSDLLRYTSGFENGPLEGLDFSGSLSFGMEEVFPHGLPIAADGYGNFWVIDLTSRSKEWGPIFYACHDPAVVIYQADNLENFIKDVIRFSNPPHQADLDEVHEEYANLVWKKNPNVLDYQFCKDSLDTSLNKFSASLDETFLFIDMRNPKFGDGFSWGRYGARTIIKRYKEERIFAYQVQKPLLQRAIHNLKKLLS